MIVIYINGEGTATKLSPEHVYQGSNQSGVLVFAPTPPQTAMGIAFKLPDGTSTPYYSMTDQGNSEGLSQYGFTIPSSITQLAGHAVIAVQAIYSDGQQNSQQVDFEIEPSLVVLPPEPTPDVYNLLKQAIAKNTADISSIQGQINNIEDLAESADRKSDNAVATANEAKATADSLASSIAQANETAQQAVDTANNAVEDIAKYKSETDSDIEQFKQTVNEEITQFENATDGKIEGITNTANGAVDTANEAKATADGLAGSIAQANTTADEAKEIAEEALEQSKVTGTKVNVGGAFQTEVSFNSNPQTQLDNKVNKSGDAMSGSLSINNGYDLSGLKRYVIDSSSLDGNTWYPVTIKVSPNKISTIKCFTSFGGESGVVSWGTHESKTISYKAVWTTQGSAYGGNYATRTIYDYCWRWGDNVFGAINQMENSSNEYIYVRGGAKYIFYVSEGAEEPIIRTSAFTASSQTISPTTTYPLLIPSNSFCSMQAIYERTKRVLSVDTLKLEPTTANGWTIGSAASDFALSDPNGVYLVKIKDGTNGWSGAGILISSYSNTFVNGKFYYGSATVQGEQYAYIVSLLLVYVVNTGNLLTANWSALKMTTDGNVLANTSTLQIAYKKIA